MNDIFGIESYGDAIATMAKKTFEGVEAFLSATCKPALDELGLMLRDHVRVWRLNNALKIVEKAKGKLEFKDVDIQLQANPKVALAIIENGSNEEDDEIQDMWAGLFVTSFSIDGKSDENLIYVSILKQLTVAEARLLKFMCESCKKMLFKNKIIGAQTISIYGDQLSEVTGIDDYNKQETVLYHLSSLKLSEKRLGLNPGGFQNHSFKGRPLVWLTPTSLALHLYLRCIGYIGEAEKYWIADLQDISQSV